MEPSDSYTIGNRKKSPSGFQDQSIYDYTDFAYQHIHQSQLVYPDLADNITLTSSASAWTLGTIVEVVPASTIALAYDPHWVTVANMSASDEFQINFYAGGAGSEELWAQVRCNRDTVFEQAAAIRIQGPPISPNVRFSAALACSGGGSETLDISIAYHTYDQQGG
jgi:hypothetical protein